MQQEKAIFDKLQSKVKSCEIYQTFRQMVPQQSSQQHGESNQKLQFIKQMYCLRSENDRLRKQISNNLHLVFSTLKQNSNQDEILKHEKEIAHFLSKDYTEKLLQTLTFCYEQTQFMISERIEAQNQITQSLESKKAQLQRIKNEISMKQSSNLQKMNSIQSKTDQFERLDSDLQGLILQYLQCRIKLLQKEQLHKSYDQEVVQNHLVQDWQKQRQYILSLLQQRTQIRKRLFMMQKAQELLNQKVIEYQALLDQFLQKKQRNDFLSQENAKISRTFNQQKERKEHLEDAKMIQVLKKQVSLSTDIVQKWDEEKRLAENILLQIIRKVNNKLPFKKLEDVTEIINAAERFYKLPKDSQRIFEEKEAHQPEIQNQANMN